MDLSTFIVSVFCLIDDHLKGRRIRRRGPAPKLSDSEVLTIEVVGEFLGLDTDLALYRYFRRHYGEWFPALCEVHRTTFLRQAANLWAIKESLWRHLLDEIRFDPAISLVDRASPWRYVASPGPTVVGSSQEKPLSVTTRRWPSRSSTACVPT